MRNLWVLVVLLSAGCARRIECTVHGGPVWRELRTEHFLMISDLPLEAARQEALDLEELRLAIRWYFQLPVEGDDHTQVVYLADRDELHEFNELDGYAHTAARPEDSFLVSAWAPAKSWRRSRTIPHELSHRFSADAFPRTAPWLEEGIASYLETAQLLGPYKASLGGIGDRFGFDGAPLPVEALFGLPNFIQLTGDAQQLAYSSAWAYVHYLSNHEQPRWSAFIEKLRKGGEPRGLFAAVFPVEQWADLQQQVSVHKRSARFRRQLVDFAYERKILEEQELPAWRVHLLRRLLEAHGTQGTEEARAARRQAEAALAAALAGAPAPYPVAEALAAGPDARHIAALGYPDDYLAQITVAQVALNLRNLEAAAKAASAALVLRPNGPSALRILGLVELQAGRIEVAAPLLARAERLAPWDVDGAFAMAQVEANRGNCEEVSRWVLRCRALDQAGSPESKQFWDDYESRTLEVCRRVSRD